MSASDQCIDENTLLDFVTGRLDKSAIARVEEHLDSCESCQMLLSCASMEGRAPSIPAPAWPQPGQRIGGRFLLMEWLGCGATGVVFAAWDEELDTEVAIKLLRWDPRSGSKRERDGMLACLRREILLGRRIAHQNVCRVYDFGSGDGYDYITMARVHGQTLADVMQERVDLDAATTILDGICAALTAAHQQGVIHRDLKPTNIMIDVAGVLTVMDFGLAHDAMSRDLSREGRLVGTPAYWAPEQLRGAPASVATDLYAVGIIAFSLLSGEPPSRLADPNPLSRVPRAFRRVLRKCLSDDVQRRPASAAELQNELRVAARWHRHRNLGRAALGFLGLGAALGLLLAACSGQPPVELRTAQASAPAFMSARADHLAPVMHHMDEVEVAVPVPPEHQRRWAPKPKAEAAPPVAAPAPFVVPVLD